MTNAYRIVLDATYEGRCFIYRADLLIASARGLTDRLALAEAMRGVRMARRAGQLH